MSTENLRYTIWSNGGRHEWIVYLDDEVVDRSGLVHANRSKARTDLRRWLRERETTV